MEEACRVRLEAALQARTAGEFISAIAETLRQNKSAFPVLRQHLQQLLAKAQDTAEFDVFVLTCLEEALANPDISTAICHLILDTLTDLDQWQQPARSETSSPQQAARVLLRCCLEQPRLAVKVAQAFHLTPDHLSLQQQVDLLDGISALLDANATSACGVSLLLHFRQLQQHFHLEAVLEDLVTSSQDPVAIRFVRELGSRDVQVQYVEYCLQYGQLRAANGAVKQFGLQSTFPDVERMHKTKQLEKLVGKGLWGVAGQYVGEDQQLQRSLVESMLLAGELALAEQHQKLFGLEGDFEIHPERLAAERQRRREQYLQLPLPPAALHFVDSVAGLEMVGLKLHHLLLEPARHGAAHSPTATSVTDSAAQQLLHMAAGSATAAAVDGGDSGGAGGAGSAGSAGDADREAELLPAIGLDLEWQPDSENSSPPSLLQISTENEVFLIDLLALTGQDEALAAALAPVLTSDHVFKLGCGIAGDCKKLAGHHPQAFSLARSCLDLSSLWRFWHIEQTGKRSTAGFKKRAGEVGLSLLAEAVIGKPLDKSCQVSDWGRRPLSQQQLVYAALDAHAAVLIFRGMGQVYHPFRTRQGLLHHAFTYDRQQAAANKAGAGGDSSGGGGGGGNKRSRDDRGGDGNGGGSGGSTGNATAGGIATATGGGIGSGGGATSSSDGSGGDSGSPGACRPVSNGAAASLAGLGPGSGSPVLQSAWGPAANSAGSSSLRLPQHYGGREGCERRIEALQRKAVAAAVAPLGPAAAAPHQLVPKMLRLLPCIRLPAHARLLRVTCFL